MKSALSILVFAVSGFAQTVSVAVAPPGDTVKIFSGNQIGSVEWASSYVLVVWKSSAGKLEVTRVFYQPHIQPGNREIRLDHLYCDSAMSQPAVLYGSAGTCLDPMRPTEQRTLQVHLANATIGTSPPGNVDAATVFGQILDVQNPVYSGNTIEFRIFPKVLQDSLCTWLKAPGRELKATFKFSSDDSEIPFSVPAHLGAGGCTSPTITIELTRKPPSRPLDYKVVVSIDKKDLPPDVQQQISDDDDGLSIAAKVPKVDPADSTKRDGSLFFLDLTFSSVVTPFDTSKDLAPDNNGKRRNAGIFAFEYRPSWYSKASASGWIGGIAPYLTADISTLPLKEADAPTQIADGVDFRVGKQFKEAAVRQLWFEPGVRHESDRDLKFQILVGTFTLTPMIRGWEKSRDYILAHNRRARLTAYTFRFSPGFEFGDVVRDRPERLIDNVNITDGIRRFHLHGVVKMEFKRLIQVEATDDYFHMWKIDRRPDRNFVSTKLVVDPDYIFRRNILGGLQKGIEFKFERGEQSPSFKPVNTLSIGLALMIPGK